MYSAGSLRGIRAKPRPSSAWVRFGPLYILLVIKGDHCGNALRKNYAFFSKCVTLRGSCDVST